MPTFGHRSWSSVALGTFRSHLSPSSSGRRSTKSVPHSLSYYESTKSQKRTRTAQGAPNLADGTSVHQAHVRASNFDVGAVVEHQTRIRTVQRAPSNLDVGVVVYKNTALLAVLQAGFLDIAPAGKSA